VIAAAPKLTAQNIAFNEVARQAILTDPISTAATTTSTAWCRRAACAWRACSATSPTCPTTRWRRNSAAACATGRSYGFDVEFEIESYLRYQGDKFAGYFDANTYLLMTKALDYFDPALRVRRQPAPRAGPRQAKFLVVVLHHRLALLARALARDRLRAGAQRRNVSYAEIDCPMPATTPSCSTSRATTCCAT
jgi:homoserine O-acetyltransferase